MNAPIRPAAATPATEAAYADRGLLPTRRLRAAADAHHD